MDRQSCSVRIGSNPPVRQGLHTIPATPPAWAVVAGRVIHHMMNDFGGGRRLLKLAWVINFHHRSAAGCVIFILSWIEAQLILFDCRLANLAHLKEAAR